MRRILVWFAAGLEAAAAVVLLAFAWQLPGAAEVESTAGRVEAVGRKAGAQVRGLSKEVGKVRKRILALQPAAAPVATPNTTHRQMAEATEVSD